MYEPECVWPLQAALGEGPVWVPSDSALWFVDIKRHRLHRHVPGAQGGSSYPAPGPCGFALPCAGGGLVVGLPHGLFRFDPDSGRYEILAEVEPERVGNRLNDGFVDPQGRLWFGSMDDAEGAPNGALYVWNGQGTPQRRDDGIPITNGPSMSPDGRTLYHTETLSKTIYAFDVAADGALSNKREFVRIAADAGYPDGSVVDAEGCLWTGLYAGWGAQRFSPSGEWLQTVRFPCANVTKLAFAGDDRRTVYATTARKGLSEDELQQQPLAGGLFRFRADVPGLPSQEVRLV